MTTPIISIIVTVYETEAFLQASLGSIQRQTFTNWECIVVDDGSPDESWKIYEAFAAKDDRFRIIKTKNQGGGAARNVGQDAARGQWIMFLDSDDYLHPQAMDTLYTVSQQREDIDLVDGWVDKIEESWQAPEALLHFSPSQQTINPIIKHFTHEGLLKRFTQFRKHFYGVVWNGLWRASAIQNHRHPQVSALGDMNYRFRAIHLLRNYAVVRVTVIYYRNRSGSELNTHKENASMPWTALAHELVDLYNTCVRDNALSGQLLRDFRTHMASRTKMYFYSPLRRWQLTDENLHKLHEGLLILSKGNFPLYPSIPPIRLLPFWFFLKTGHCYGIRRWKYPKPRI